MGRTREIFEQFNQRKMAELTESIRNDNEPVETMFSINPEDSIFHKTFEEICKEEQYSHNKVQSLCTENGIALKTDS